MSMTPATRLDVQVEVLVDGRWWPGTLEHRRPLGEGWQGFVRYSTGVGQNRIGWLDSGMLRRRDEDRQP